MISINQIPDDPQYNIKTVCAQTGIRPVTLRAWERRYQLLQPARSENHYRRYSDRDIAILLWVKRRIESGVSISNAVHELKNMVENGVWPDAAPLPPRLGPTLDHRTPEAYTADLYQALICHDEIQANQVFEAASLVLDINALFLNVISPTLYRIGDAWNNGEIRIATEHFASNFIRARLEYYLHTFRPWRNAPYIITGCAPEEFHEIGILIFSIMLRREGYRVEFLGQDIPLDDLIDYVAEKKPAMILLSATMEKSAFRLKDIQSRLSKISPQPIFGFGGLAFNENARLRIQVPGVFLGENADHALADLKRLLDLGRNGRKGNSQVKGA